ncbi:inter-alpha-trypsin inhibitor heavy chain H5-like isoform X2 [Scylla paramamosain]
MLVPCPHLPLLVPTFLLLVFVTQAAGWRGVVGRVEVRTEISQRYSATLYRVTLHNPHPKPDHVTLAMVLPADAYVSSLTIEAGGRNITTKVEEKRRTKGPKTSGDTRTTSGSSRYLPQETQRFKASMKVAPLEQATFHVAYEELLQRARGKYTFSVHLPPYSGTGTQQVEVRVKEKEAIQNFLILLEPNPSAATQERVSDNEIILTYQRGGEKEREEEKETDEEGRGGEQDTTDEEERHHLRNTTTSNTRNTSRGVEVATIDSSSNRSGRSVRNVQKSRESNATGGKEVLRLSYDVQRTVDGGEVQVLGRFFVHYLSPEGLPKLPAHTVFALDVSGSMSDHGKLDQLKEAIIAIIRRMPQEDSFEVLVFSTRVKSLGVYQALPDQVEQGVAKIQALRALGGTNINDALLQAVTGANTHNSTHAPARQVVFLTDGKPNIGETNPEQLRRNVREANHHQLPVFSLALGQDADVRLLRQVSADNEGFTRTLNEEGQARGGDEGVLQ